MLARFSTLVDIKQFIFFLIHNLSPVNFRTHRLIVDLVTKITIRIRSGFIGTLKHMFFALLIGVARIIAGVHFPIDILGGFIIGFIVAYFIKKFSKYIYNI